MALGMLQIPPGAPRITGLTSISSGMRSGPFWFLPTFHPHLKTSGAGSGAKIDLSGPSDPSVCVGFGRPGAIDLLTSEQQVTPGEVSPKSGER